MKEVSIEEKVKRYDEKLDVARHIYADPSVNDEDKYYIEVIFPELAESEDERIREKVIATIHLYYGEPLEDEAKKMIAWLEKQGTPYTKRDIDDAYLKGVTDTKNEIEKQYEANYQIRKDIATFIFNYRGDIKDRAKWMNYLGIKVSFVEKQGEQKPAVWSEEDREMARFIGNAITTHESKDYLKQKNIEVIDAHVWLKSLKDRVHLQPKQEWSEEDENHVISITQIIACAIKHNVVSKKTGEMEISWLKSLRPENTWKPSELDILLLERIANGKSNPQDFQATLCCLIEQIKKLREE